MAEPKSFDDCLPLDMQYEILINCGLPIKSLLSFRFISKDGKLDISSPNFISQHFKFNLAKSLSHNNDDNNNNGYLLCKTAFKKGLCAVVCNTDHNLTEISSWEIPIEYDRIVGFCNGIFCLVREGYEAPYDSPTDKRIFPWTYDVYLWNPSIRKYKKLPTAHTTDRFDGIACGIGCNPQNNDFDFKVLRFGLRFRDDPPTTDEPDFQVRFRDDPLPTDKYNFQVYSLSTNSWKKLRSFNGSRGPTTSIDQSSCLFFNRALHFIAYSGDHKFILSFDLYYENFREITLPQEYDRLRFDRLAVLNGSLAWIAFAEGDEHEIDLIEVCYIWVMGAYGAVESWNENTVRLEDVESFFGCTGRGELVIKKSSFPNQLFLFDPVTRGEKNIGIGDLTPEIYTANLMESLVLLNEPEP